MTNFDNLIPVYLCNDADRLAISEDNVLYMHMLRAKLESDLSDMDMDFEDVESIPVHTGRKLSHKQRRARRRVQNARHKQSDRAHGKRHGDKYLESLSRKKYLEVDNYDHPTFRVEKGKLRPVHDVKQEREMAKVRDALDISPVERLTASVLAHMSNHVFMWDEQLVWDLTEALCEEYRQVFPDDSYICIYGKHINLYMQYMDGNGILQDEQRYTLR